MWIKKKDWYLQVIEVDNLRRDLARLLLRERYLLRHLGLMETIDKIEADAKEDWEKRGRPDK